MRQEQSRANKKKCVANKNKWDKWRTSVFEVHRTCKQKYIDLLKWTESFGQSISFINTLYLFILYIDLVETTMQFTTLQPTLRQWLFFYFEITHSWTLWSFSAILFGYIFHSVDNINFEFIFLGVLSKKVAENFRLKLTFSGNNGGFLIHTKKSGGF